MTAAGIYAGGLWHTDRRLARAARAQADGSPPSAPGLLPGATDAPGSAVWIAVAGAWLILVAETSGEKALGLAAQQSRITWLFGLYSVVSAPIIEELIFRGWIVLTTRGHAVMWTAAAAASILFAALHPFLWRWDDAGFAFTLTTKGWFSTGAVFATSLWLYAARLAGWNPQRSLLPCFAAHAAKNLGVVAIKASAGFVVGVW